MGCQEWMYCGTRKTITVCFLGYPLRFDEVGTHQVDYELWLVHPVVDGYDSDGDGRPDMYRGSLGTASTTIEVVLP